MRRRNHEPDADGHPEQWPTMSWFLPGRGAPPGLLEPLLEIGTAVEHAPTKFENWAHASWQRIFSNVCFLSRRILGRLGGVEEI